MADEAERLLRRTLPAKDAHQGEQSVAPARGNGVGAAGRTAVDRIAKEICFVDVNNFKGPITATNVCTTDVAAYLDKQRRAVLTMGGANKPEANRAAPPRSIDPRLVANVKSRITDMLQAPKETRAGFANNLREEVVRLSAAFQSQPIEVEAKIHSEIYLWCSVSFREGLEVKTEAENILLEWQDQLLTRARVRAGVENQYRALEAQIRELDRRINETSDDAETIRLIDEKERLTGLMVQLRGDSIFQSK